MQTRSSLSKLFLLPMLALWAVPDAHAGPGPPSAAHDQPIASPYRPRGRIVVIKSRFGYLHRMYVDCRGDVEPTVLVDVGIGGASSSWLNIARRVAKHVRICTYDRSGYGYSGTGPGERTTRQIVEELHDLLITAHIPGPYVLVGHSFGGFTARYFAARHPDETVGLVLVDSSHPEQIERLAALDERARRERRKLVVSRRELVRKRLDTDEEQWYRLNSSRKATFAQMNELKYFEKSAQQVDKAPLARQLPIAVLTRGKRQLPVIDGVSLEQEWQSMQQQLTTLSERSWQKIIRQSGHDIHKDAPAEVTAQILKVIALAQKYQGTSEPFHPGMATGRKTNRRFPFSSQTR